MKFKFALKGVLLNLFLVFNLILSNQQADLRRKFEDVLLIVNYNHPCYQSIDFLKKMYGTVFENIVFYGEKEDSRVHTIDHHYGWYGYKSLADAMKRYPNFKGYLYTNDDCIVNCWNFSRFDKKKFWFTKVWKFADLTKGVMALQEYGAWNSSIGYFAIKGVYANLDDKFMRMLSLNCGNNSVAVGYSDILYVPSGYQNDFIKLSDLCCERKVFLGIAIPTICACLEKISNWQFFTGCALWGEKRKEWQKAYNDSLDYLHPIKFSDKTARDFIQKFYIR